MHDASASGSLECPNATDSPGRRILLDVPENKLKGRLAPTGFADGLHFSIDNGDDRIDIEKTADKSEVVDNLPPIFRYLSVLTTAIRQRRAA
jgi:hypothetical protein